MPSKVPRNEISQIDQIQANIFLKKIKNEFKKLEEEYNKATSYKRNSIYQKMKSLKKYMEDIS